MEKLGMGVPPVTPCGAAVLPTGYTKHKEAFCIHDACTATCLSVRKKRENGTGSAWSNREFADCVECLLLCSGPGIL